MVSSRVIRPDPDSLPFGMHCRRSEVSESQRGLAVILQCMNRSNGILLDETICIVTKFHIDLLQSSIIHIQPALRLSRHVVVYVTSVLGST
jgi:hypothetical protein